MNSAKRIEKILSKVESSIELIAIKTFEEVFEVQGCIAVANKLRICHSQVEQLIGVHQSVTVYLNALFNCTALNRDIRTERKNINTHIIALHSMGYHMKEEKVNEEDLTKLAEMILEMEDKVKKLDISSEYKTVLEQYIQEMQEALVDIHIGGIEAFEKHIIVANGTMVLYNEAFTNTGLSETAGKIYETSTKIISDVSTWSGTLGFTMGIFLGK